LPPQAARTEGPPKGADAPMHQSREAHHPARPLHSPEGGHDAAATRVYRLLLIVADYKRLSVVHVADCAGRGRASGPQYPGVLIQAI
jgi:hypothetical protein